MKHMISITAIITFILMAAPPASALPLYITVTGNITSISDADGDMTHSKGDEVSCVFLADKAQDGYETADTGITTLADTSTSFMQSDYYLSEYIEGDALMADNNSQNTTGLCTGYDAVIGQNRIQKLYGKTDNTRGTYAQISLLRYSTGDYEGFNSFNFDIGDEFELRSHDGYDTFYDAMVYITHVSGKSPSTAPVPEPASMLLFGLGLMALAGYKKRFKP